MATIPNNMTIEQFAERFNRRESLLKSQIAADGAQFTVADATRHLSDYRAGQVVTHDEAKRLLDKMVEDGLLRKERTKSRNRYSTIPAKSGAWAPPKLDSGSPIGLHQPPSREQILGAA